MYVVCVLRVFLCDVCQTWLRDLQFNDALLSSLPSQVFRSDGGNGYNVFTEEEANIEQKRNKPKKVSPRMR